jgi:signal transduction histidine kinase
MNDHNKTKTQLIAELIEFRLKHETCLKNLENKSEDKIMFEKFFELSPFSVQICDKNGYTIRRNKAHYELFKEVPDEDFSIFDNPIFNKLGFKKKLERLRNGYTVRFKDHQFNAAWISSKYSDHMVWLTALGFAISDDNNKPFRYVLIHRDIGYRIKSQLQLKKLNERLRLVNAHIQQVAEDESKRISFMLHDAIGKSLMESKLIIEKLVYDMPNVKQKNKIESLADNIITIIDHVQNLNSTIKPPSITHKGIQETIEIYVKKFSRLNNLHFKAEMDNSLSFTNSESVQLFRITEQILNNIKLHSKAKSFEIKLIKDDRKIKYSITDDGIGIDEDKILSDKSMGIMIMEERAATMNGIFTITHQKPHGTKIEITLPLKKQ